MRKTGRAKISQCMIVKNEEKNIVQALSWGKGIVTEQIVVDTGSTDRTVEIAEEMGAKVYHFAWINDFSAAKNFAISKARYGWIAFLDADEYFPEQDAKKLLPLLEKLQPYACDGVETDWIHLNNEGKVMSVDAQIRIFRNQPDLRYVRKIHEHLVAADGRNLQIWSAVGDISIYHTGYGQKEMEEKKVSQRNLKLILEEIEENPDKYEMYGYLGNEYEAAGEWDKARKAYQKAVSLMPESTHGTYDMETSGFYFRLLELLTVFSGKGENSGETENAKMEEHSITEENAEKGENSGTEENSGREVNSGTEEQDILALYRKAAAGWPQEGDYDYLLGTYYAVHGRFGEGERYLSQALDKLERYKNPQCCALMSANMMKLYELLAMCCLNHGNRNGCVKYTAALLKENPYLMTTVILFISAFYQDMAVSGREKDGAGEVAALLGKSFYNFQSLKDRIFVLRAAMDAGYSELVEVIRSLFSPEELEQVDRALGKNG